MIYSRGYRSDFDRIQRRKAIDWVENTIKAEGIECKFHRVDGYLIPFTGSDDDYKKLEQELPAAHKVVLVFSFIVEFSSLLAVGLLKGIMNAWQGQVLANTRQKGSACMCDILSMFDRIQTVFRQQWRLLAG